MATWNGTITFNGITLEASFQPPARERAADVSVRHVPGSGAGGVAAVDVVDIGGAHATETITLTLFFPTAAAYLAFEAQVGTSAHLLFFDSYDAGGASASNTSYYTAVLTRLHRVTRNLTLSGVTGGVSVGGETHADAEFLLTAFTL